MKKALSFLAVLSAGIITSHASVNWDPTVGNYSENFDTFPTTGNTALTPTIGTQNALPNVGFEATKTAGTGTTLNFVTDTGASNSGAVYNYGATGSTDRALGELASSGAIVTFGIAITNTSAAALNGVYLAFNGEQWRSSTTTTNVLSFAYGTSDASGTTATASNYLTDTTLTANTAFNIVGQPFVTTTNGPTDGNTLSTYINGLLSITLNPGATLYLRWSDVNDPGSDAGLAIDNFVVSSTPITAPEPSTLAGLALGSAFLVARRRRALRA